MLPSAQTSSTRLGVVGHRTAHAVRVFQIALWGCTEAVVEVPPVASVWIVQVFVLLDSTLLAAMDYLKESATPVLQERI